MRLHPSLLLSLLAATPPAAAQTPAAQTGWRLGGGVEAVQFAHVARSVAAPGAAAEVRPSGRPALHFSLGRRQGAWDVDVEAGWAGGHIEAGNEAVSIEDKRSDVSRYRLAASLARRVADAGGAEVLVGLVPSLDLWTVEGNGRLRGGAEARLVLRVPLGRIALENRIGFGLSASPIEASDIGQVADLRGLRSLSVGIGARWPL